MSPRILVIENERHWYKLFEGILKGMECDVDIANNYEKAKTLVKESRYDLVLLDICLTADDVTWEDQLLWEFLKTEHHDLPTVAVTGHRLKPPHVFLLAKLGIDDLLYKPEIQVPDFRRRIRAALRANSDPQRVSMSGLSELQANGFVDHYNGLLDEQSLNTAAIRDLVTCSFSDEELVSLCFDHFPEVYAKFSTGMTKEQKIHLLLDYCTRKLVLNDLLSRVEKANPAQYNRFVSNWKKQDSEQN